MSTGTVLLIAITATVLLVAGGMTHAALVHASATSRRNEVGHASDAECAQADLTGRPHRCPGRCGHLPARGVSSLRSSTGGRPWPRPDSGPCGGDFNQQQQLEKDEPP